MQRREYDSHPHPSEAEARANVIAAQALKHVRPVLERSRAAAPGPAISGYNFLSTAVGRNIAAAIPGTLTQSGKRPSYTKRGVLKDAFLLQPYLRGVRAPYRAARALRARKPPREVLQAARTPIPWFGPSYRAGARAYLEHDQELVREYARLYTEATGRQVGDLSDPDELARFTREVDPWTALLVLQQALREKR